jgi:hypothetical protein
MGRTLYVAAGGGGDVIGATMLHAAIGSSDRAQIATFSWDRLLVDPVPGPRDPTEFDELQAMGRWNYRITAATTTRSPAASSLPRLARELPADLYLLDPRAGTVGLARQLGELAEELQASSVCVVDVGGDILARGDEATLRSPLADSLVVAALADHPLPVQLVVAGVGLDGELDPSYLLGRLADLGARPCGAVRREEVLPVADVFRWHLTEASGLLAAAAMGARGRARMQAGKSVVELTEGATVMHSLGLQALLSEASPAKALRGASSLEEAQDALVALGAKSELEYERQKAAGSELTDRVLGADALLRAVDSLADEATSDGVDLLTLRRVAEALGLTGEGFAANLGTLRRLRALQCCPPVWVVNPVAWPVALRPLGDTSYCHIHPPPAGAGLST